LTELAGTFISCIDVLIFEKAVLNNIAGGVVA
jgi:hypothetical protein